MAGSSTIYDVAVNYSVKDNASAALEHLGHTAEKTEHHVAGLKEGFQHLVELFAVEKGLEFAKEMFVGLNSEMEQMQIHMAGITSFNLKVPFEEAAESTDALIEQWEKLGTEKFGNFAKFGSSISGVVMAAGGSLKDLNEIVTKGMPVLNVLGAGTEGGVGDATASLASAILGKVRKTNIKDMQLLTPVLSKMGMDIDKFNTLSTTKRMDIVKMAISDPSWNAAITKMDNSWAGVTGRLKQSLELTAKEVGLPLFKALTSEVKSWNDWLVKNKESIADFAHKFSEGLMKGFEVVKNVFGFIIEHKDILLKIGEGFLAFKTAGIIGGMARGFNPGQGLAGFLSPLVSGIQTFFIPPIKEAGAHVTGFSSGLLGAVSTFTNLAAAGAALYAALQFIADKFGERQSQRIAVSGDFGSLKSELIVEQITKRLGGMDLIERRDHTDERAAFRRAKELGAFGADGIFDASKFRANLEQMAANSDDSQQNLKDVPLMVQSMEALVKALGPEEIAKRLGLDETHKKMGVDQSKTGRNGPVNVTIQKIEVASDDPDRFAFALDTSFRKLRQNPTAAADALAGGT